MLLGVSATSNTVIIIVLGLVTLAAILVFLWWRRRLGLQQAEPIIELEKLVHCTSCGSLVPEGVRLCAFCGKEQVRAGSGE